MNIKFITIIMLAGLGLPLSSLAGNEGGGGGDGFKCGKSVYLVDTYKNRLLGKPDEAPLFYLDIYRGLKFVSQNLNQNFPSRIFTHPYDNNRKINFGTYLYSKWYDLEFYQTEKELKDLPDDNIKFYQVPWGCKKVQLAIQDIKTKKVRLSVHVKALSPQDRFFLYLHEYFIAIRNSPGKDTTEVRQQIESVSAYLLTHFKKIISRANAKYIRELDRIKTTDDIVRIAHPKQLKCSIMARRNFNRKKKEAPIDRRKQAYWDRIINGKTISLSIVDGNALPGWHNQFQLQFPNTILQSYRSSIYKKPLHFDLQVFTTSEAQFKFRNNTVVTKIAYFDSLLGTYIGEIKVKNQTGNTLSLGVMRCSSHGGKDV